MSFFNSGVVEYTNFAFEEDRSVPYKDYLKFRRCPYRKLPLYYLHHSHVGGMFYYVSGANYFGESLEWSGYAIACWSMVAAQFAIWAIVFLGSRALQYHK